MAPHYSMVYFIGILIPILFFAAFFGSLFKSLFEVFRRQNHLQTVEAPLVKDGLDILYEGLNPEVE